MKAPSAGLAVHPAQAAPGQEAYIVYADAVLPAIVPVGFMLLEPDSRRRR